MKLPDADGRINVVDVNDVNDDGQKATLRRCGDVDDDRRAKEVVTEIFALLACLMLILLHDCSCCSIFHMNMEDHKGPASLY